MYHRNGFALRSGRELLETSPKLLRQSEEKPSIAAIQGNFFPNNMAARGELDYCADEGTDEGSNEGAEGGDLGREGANLGRGRERGGGGVRKLKLSK